MKRAVQVIILWFIKQYRNIGVFLYGSFFKKLYRAQTLRQRQIRESKAFIHRMQKRGMRVYTIDGVSVWARNERNARRKVKALHEK